MLRKSGRDWTFVLVDDAGRPVVRGRVHASRAFALRAIEEIREVSGTAAAFVRVTTDGGLHAFGVVASDGRRLAGSSYFASINNRDSVLDKCARVAAESPVAEDVAHLRGPGDDTRNDPGVPAKEGGNGGGALIRVETSRGGYRLVLFGADDRWLLGTPPQKTAQAALSLLEELRASADDDQLYTRHSNESGDHWFELQSRAGVEIARSSRFPTVREREDRLARCKAAAHQAVQGEGART